MDQKEDLRDTLGVYALGAVDDITRRRIDHLVATDEPARVELAEYQLVAEALAAMHSTPPPDALWGKISDAVEAPPVDRLLAAARRPSWIVRRATPLLAAAAAVIVLVVAVSIGQYREIDRLTAMLNTPVASIAATDLEVNLASPAGASVDMAIVVDGEGRSQVTRSSLRPLPDDLVYQLWAIMDDGRVISVALLGGEASTAEFFVDDIDGLAGFAVTEEIQGGVVASTNDAVVVGLIDA